MIGEALSPARDLEHALARALAALDFERARSESSIKSPAFVDFLSRLAGARLLPCPDDDPHACALYFYAEPGDHMGFHYDNSYYRGAHRPHHGVRDQPRDGDLQTVRVEHKGCHRLLRPRRAVQTEDHAPVIAPLPRALQVC